MSLITLLDASLRFGDESLLDHADFSLEEGQKICEEEGGISEILAEAK